MNKWYYENKDRKILYDINDNNVVGVYDAYYLFDYLLNINNKDYKIKNLVFIPKCCLECEHFKKGEIENSIPQEPSYCDLNLFFPTKKGTCKCFKKMTK